MQRTQSIVASKDDGLAQGVAELNSGGNMRRGLCLAVTTAACWTIVATALTAQAVTAQRVPPTAPSSSPAAKQASAQPKTSALTNLTNADIARLVAAQVSEATVIAVVNEARDSNFDLSASAVGELVLHGASSAIIATMRQTSRPTPPVAGTATAAKPSEGFDRQKFDKVYAAGKTVETTMFSLDWDGLSPRSVTPKQFKQFLLDFQIEVSIAMGKSSGLAEDTLAVNYSIALSKFEIAFNNLSMNRYLSPEKSGMLEAAASLAVANKLYLAK